MFYEQSLIKLNVPAKNDQITVMAAKTRKNMSQKYS